MWRKEWFEPEKQRLLKQNGGDHMAIVARKKYHIVERLWFLHLAIAIPINDILADQIVAEDDPV